MREFDKNFNVSGFNKAKKELALDELFLSQEPFYTVQGEGKYSGTPAFFVRTAYCNFSCFFCDTEEWDKNKIKYNMAQLHNKLESLNPDCKLIVFTGGEPSMQLSDFFTYYFTHAGYKINIETNGSIWNNNFNNPNVFICVSPKRLSDQKALNNTSDKYLYNEDVIRIADEIKFIVDYKIDSDMLIDTANNMKKIMKKDAKIFLSPMDLYDNEMNRHTYNKLKELVLNNPTMFTISLQTHKILHMP